MREIYKSASYERWFRKLKDRQAQARINARIRRIEESGNFGDAKPVRDGVSEMRIDYGPGYRLYFMQRGSVWVLLLAGGDKSTQQADIRAAIEIAKEWKD
ncbi:MAG: addiction module antitoxin RelB [Betaproteobacteria bacterium HGW-Betaproteobacteria-11]|nr:MAG: addiction module antitoxin RelB [Betaproteobacteria bacterium HGW-Betaproteobacteria-11]